MNCKQEDCTHMPETPYEHTFLYKLLMLPHYRLHRHMIILLCVIVISLEQTVGVYDEVLPELGLRVIPICLGILTVYLLAGYINFYLLIPRYLLKKEFGRYIISLILVALLATVLQYLQELFIHRSLDIVPNEISYLYDRHAQYMVLEQLILLPFSLIGIAMAKMLKYWILENQRVKELENVRLKTELEKLKEQVNPRFLFNILNRTGNLALEKPDQASEMIILLSRLLRYQLYDGEYRKVLVSSELQFLINYLKLEQLYSGKIAYQVLPEGELQYTFIPPLILLPFVQHSVKKRYMNEETEPILIRVEQTGKQLIFRINEKVDLADMDFIPIHHRLKLLFGKEYTLQKVAQGERNLNWIELKLNT